MAFVCGRSVWNGRASNGPARLQDEVITLTGQQLNWLLDGYDVMRMQPHERLHYSSVL